MTKVKREDNKISIIIPFYNEELGIAELFERIKSTILKLFRIIDVELILVDDHSSDNTHDLIKKFCDANSFAKYLRLSKNSGSHISIIAGLSVSKGKCAVFLAGDLQDPPELIEKMITLWQSQNDVVWAVRKRIDGISIFNKFFSSLFYKIINLSSSVKLPPTGADFALLDRKVIDGLIQSTGCTPSLGSLISSIGFKQTQIEYIKEARHYGKSKWTFTKKMHAFIDAIVGFSFLPMRIMTYLGFTISICGFLYALLIVFLKLHAGRQIEGWASIMVVVLFIGGVQMIMLGVLGEYLWRNLEESRKNPLFYIENQSSNVHQEINE